MSGKNKYYILFSLIVTFAIFILYNINVIHKGYYVLFRKNGVIEHYNSKHHLDEEFFAYINGKVNLRANFVDGSREGAIITYYDNGNIKNSESFKHDKIEGTEREYYENGELNYIADWKNNKRYGSEYHYLQNKQLFNCSFFDIDNLFCYTEFKDSKLSKMIGNLISPNIYSVNLSNKSNFILKDKGSYSNFLDLYIMVANPPTVQLKVNITINKKALNGFKIVENTIKIPDAFKEKGAYDILIEASLLNSNRKVMKKDSLRYSITKE